MRLLGVALFLALAGSVASADEGTTPPAEPRPEPVKAKVPLRLVRMLPETHQALLFDRQRGTHVLAEIGGTVDGFRVADIDDDEVTLEGASGEIVLTAPPRWHGDESDDRPAHHAERAERREAKAEPQPEDPYTADDSPVPVPVADSAAPPIADDPAPAPAPAPTSSTISRLELRLAMANFSKLAASFRGGFVADGVKVDGVTEGSLFARAGLRAGDLVRAVDNQPLHSIDDAADLYARAGSARNITIQVVRGGKPLTLRVAIQ